MRGFSKVDRTQHQSYKPWQIGAFPKKHSDVELLKDSDDGLEIDLIFYNQNQTITVKFAYRIYRNVSGYRRRAQAQATPALASTNGRNSIYGVQFRYCAGVSR